MSKKMLLAAAVMMLASCTNGNKDFVHYCPNVHIVPENSRLTHTAGRVAESKVELVGFEGYCRTDARGYDKAFVSPIFEIIRYSEASDDYVQFNYYTDTGKYSSKKFSQETYFVSAPVPELGKKTRYQGDYVEVQIPYNQPGFRIDMGLLLSDYQSRYNRTHGLK